MRLLINSPITVSGSFGLEDLENGEQEYMQEVMEDMSAICNKFSIVFDYYVYESGYKATLHVQKIDLMEYPMNKFLNEAFQIFEHLKVVYLPRAAGCGITMELV